MPIEWKPKRIRLGQPLSFRFAEETAFRLRVLAEASNSKQVEVLDQLVNDAYTAAEKSRPKEITSAVAVVKKASKAKK